MITIYVVMDRESGLPVDMAQAASSDEATAMYSRWGPHGDLYACRVSPEVATEARKARPEAALKMLKTYSHSMNKCGDV